MLNLWDLIYSSIVSGKFRFYSLLPSLFFLAIPVIIWAYFTFQHRRRWRIRYPIASVLAKVPGVKRVRRHSRHIPMVLRILALVFVILAMMRPQIGSTRETIKTQGVDIMLVLDISPSMMASDFKPNRVESAKKVLMEFVRKNRNDRLGLVVFSAMPFTQCPITSDTAILEEFIAQVQIGDITASGTAIGDAIVTAAAKFPDPDVKGKVMILTTDGENNLGQYQPGQAARIASRLGIKIYTIGVGKVEGVPISDPHRPGDYLRDQYGQIVFTRLDEATLNDIARVTGGRYFRAEDESALEKIYDEISRLETHEIEKHQFTIYSEIYQYFLFAALIFFAVEIISRLFWGKVLP